MKLSLELHQKIVSFLESLPNIEPSNSRHALINSASLDQEIQKQIVFSEPVSSFFQSLVPLLFDYGDLRDERDALEAVLEAAKDSVGKKKREACDKLIEDLRKFRQSHTEDHTGGHREQTSEPLSMQLQFLEERLQELEKSYQFVTKKVQALQEAYQREMSPLIKLQREGELENVTQEREKIKQEMLRIASQIEELQGRRD